MLSNVAPTKSGDDGADGVSMRAPDARVGAMYARYNGDDGKKKVEEGHFWKSQKVGVKPGNSKVGRVIFTLFP
jgi:hypothetical protein